MAHLPLADAPPHGMNDAIAVRPTRVICVAWGEKYIERLLRFSLPAALAPGNYPYLAKHLDCELNIVTERRLFATVEDSDVVAQYRKLGAVRLTAIDDLLTPVSYGLTLTLALARGFEDLGPEMVNTNLLFLNADFILADGSYRAVVDRILSGERLLMAPSYCAISERVSPVLRRSYADSENCIAISNRAMAKLILDNLHSTVAGQTIDAPYHFDHVYIYQFYARPDAKTLVGHQMPIAIVAMRPSRYVSALDTFWDWGAASEYCPDVTPCVIGDSDDFLMLELREQSEGEDLLRLGSPNPAKIAELLAPILTSDQRRCVTAPLTLHSDDLPSTVGLARDMVQAFASEVLADIGHEPVPHRNHAQWKFHTALLREHRKQAVPRLTLSAVTEVGKICAKALRDQIECAGHQFVQDLVTNSSAGVEQVSADFKRQAREQLRRFIVLQGTRLSIFQELLDEVCISIERELNEPIPHDASLDVPNIVEPVALDTLLHPDQSSGRAVSSILRSVQHWLFGQVPFVSSLHPLAAIFDEPAETIRNEIDHRSNVLVIGGAPGLVSHLLGKRVNVATLSAVNARQARLALGEAFDFCYCELMPGDFLHLQTIYSNITGALRPGTKVLSLVRSDTGQSLALDDPSIVRTIARTDGAMRVRYCEDKEVLQFRSRIERRLNKARRSSPLLRAYFIATAFWTVLWSLPINKRAKQRTIWKSVRGNAEECVALLLEFIVPPSTAFRADPSDPSSASGEGEFELKQDG